MNADITSLCGGIALVSLSLIYLALVLWRFEWLLRFALTRVLLRWGRGDWSYPASKLGACTGGILALVVGCIFLDQYFRFLPDKTWAVIFLSLLPFVIGAAIHDYRKRKQTAKVHEASPPILQDDETA